eukprot:TRINITY_DN6846_c0_g1_i2.p1 TRINITY_DN6846_c0_g1~~TRINITY_DN6846_c0_g1_i2.p1  ORF type:complete len:632 (+),score=90.04 TRINITY_DN6846_c0_g1_i2:96-1991(+)
MAAGEPLRPPPQSVRTSPRPDLGPMRTYSQPPVDLRWNRESDPAPAPRPVRRVVEPRSPYEHASHTRASLSPGAVERQQLSARGPTLTSEFAAQTGAQNSEFRRQREQRILRTSEQARRGADPDAPPESARRAGSGAVRSAPTGVGRAWAQAPRGADNPAEVEPTPRSSTPRPSPHPSPEAVPTYAAAPARLASPARQPHRVQSGTLQRPAAEARTRSASNTGAGAGARRAVGGDARRRSASHRAVQPQPLSLRRRSADRAPEGRRLRTHSGSDRAPLSARSAGGLSASSGGTPIARRSGWLPPPTQAGDSSARRLSPPASLRRGSPRVEPLPLPGASPGRCVSSPLRPITPRGANIDTGGLRRCQEQVLSSPLLSALPASQRAAPSRGTQPTLRTQLSAQSGPRLAPGSSGASRRSPVPQQRTAPDPSGAPQRSRSQPGAAPVGALLRETPASRSGAAQSQRRDDPPRRPVAVGTRQPAAGRLALPLGCLVPAANGGAASARQQPPAPLLSQRGADRSRRTPQLASARTRREPVPVMHLSNLPLVRDQVNEVNGDWETRSEASEARHRLRTWFQGQSCGPGGLAPPADAPDPARPLGGERWSDSVPPSPNGPPPMPLQRLRSPRQGYLAR